MSFSAGRHYYATRITEGDGERIIRPANPYVFRVRDGYHELLIKHYYDGADYVSDDDMEGASAADLSDSSAESDVRNSQESMNNIEKFRKQHL